MTQCAQQGFTRINSTLFVMGKYVENIGDCERMLGIFEEQKEGVIRKIFIKRFRMNEIHQ